MSGSFTAIAARNVASFSRVEDWPQVARDYFDDRTISAETIERAGIVYAGADKAEERTGHRCAGVLIPILDLETGSPVGAPILRPLPGKEGGAKFLHKKDEDTRLYFAPMLDRKWIDVRDDATVPIYIPEGPLKALRLAQDRFAAMCGNGVSGLGGKKGPHRDLDKVKWNGRRAVLVPDSDWATNTSVRQAIMAAAGHLRVAGANVYIKLQKPLPGQDKSGPDDVLSAPDGLAIFNNSDEVSAEDARFATWSIRPEVLALNQHHAIITLSSGVRILVEPDAEHPHYRLLSRSDFLALYENRRVVVGKKDNGTPIIETEAQIWLKSEHRRQYRGVGFYPGNEVPVPADIYNTWRGWPFPVERGDWSLLRLHIRQVIAGRDQDHFEWILNWLAYRVQCPGREMPTTIVLHGDEGVGKGVFAESFGALFGPHFVTSSKADEIIGRFNSRLESALLVFADEAFFAGNPQHADTLQSLITAQKLTIERKGFDAYEVPNRLGVIMASNHEQVVRAGPNARRYAVFEVADAHMEDFEYFEKIRNQLQAGGYSGMLHDLLNYKVDHIAVRRVPRTKALTQQKLLSFKPVEQWLFECLQQGVLGGGKLSATNWPETTQLVVERERLQDSLSQWLNDQRAGEFTRRSLSTTLGATLHRIFGEVRGDRVTGSDSKIRRRDTLPNLMRARRLFERAMQARIDWETGEPDKDS